jgi:phage gp36-like protein
MSLDDSATPSIAYCSVSDLLVKDVLQGRPGLLQDWVNRAAEEMDSLLGFRYVVPLRHKPNLPGFHYHEQLIIKQINAKLASGRYLMAQHQNDERDRLHAYGRALVNEALKEIEAIASGKVDLASAVLFADAFDDDTRRLPQANNYDEESLLHGWENTVLRGDPWYSRPGQVP